jgi:alkylhydroperoxidase family enzyme
VSSGVAIIISQRGTLADTAVPDADFQADSAVFSEKELADLTIAIGLMNAYNRLAIGSRVPPKASLSEQQDQLQSSIH